MTLSLILICSVIGQGSSLADIGPAPGVELVDQSGRPFVLASVEGKAVLVSFVYTSCNGTCPMTTVTLDRVRRSLQAEKLWGSSVEFVSISLDPDRDTPQVLTRYAKGYRADPKAWHFLTGTPDRVHRVIKAWDMWARVGPSGTIDHPSRVFLVDPKGHRREIYSLETMTPEDVVRDVKTVLAEGTATR